MPIINLCVFLSVASIGAFSGGFWAISAIAGGIILYALACTGQHRLLRLDRTFTTLGIATLALIALNNVVSTNPAVSWSEWLRLASIFVPLLLLLCPSIISLVDHPKLFPVMAIVVALVSILLGIELSSGEPLLQTLKGHPVPLTDYNRGISYIVLLAFPLIAWLWLSGRQRLAILFFLVLLIPTSLTESRAAKLAMVAGLGVTVLAALWPLWTQRGLMLITTLCSFWSYGARFLFTQQPDMVKHLPDSWRARVEIWDYMSYRIDEHPLLGWGLGNSRALDYVHPHGALYSFIVNQPAPHPHNMLTQLWVELGLPGLALGLLFAYLTLRKINTLPPSLAPFATGAWMAALCLSLVAYNFWSDSLFAAFTLTALAFGLLANKKIPVRTTVTGK
jgi:hypothetical protein